MNIKTYDGRRRYITKPIEITELVESTQQARKTETGGGIAAIGPLGRIGSLSPAGDTGTVPSSIRKTTTIPGNPEIIITVNAVMPGEIRIEISIGDRKYITEDKMDRYIEIEREIEDIQFKIKVDTSGKVHIQVPTRKYKDTEK